MSETLFSVAILISKATLFMSGRNLFVDSVWLLLMSSSGTGAFVSRYGWDVVVSRRYERDHTNIK